MNQADSDDYAFDVTKRRQKATNVWRLLFVSLVPRDWRGSSFDTRAQGRVPYYLRLLFVRLVLALETREVVPWIPELRVRYHIICGYCL
jgi:hypothetical protein